MNQPTCNANASVIQWFTPSVILWWFELLCHGLAATCAATVHFDDCYDHVITVEALRGCTAVTSISMDNALEYIGDYAFYECTNLLTISWSDNIREIGQYAFAYCKKVQEMILPSKLKTILSYAFHQMESLTKLVFPEGIENIGYFWGWSPNCAMSITNTGGTARYEVQHSYYLYTKGCAFLTWVAPHSSTATLNIDTRCTEIGQYALRYCQAGPTLTIPNHIKKIHGWVFWQAPTLNKVIIGSNMDTILSTAFLTAYKLLNIEVDVNNQNYASYNGVLYNKDLTKVEFYPTAKTDTIFRLPKTVKEFGSTPMPLNCPVQKFIFSDDTKVGTYLKITDDQKSLITLDGKKFVRTATNHQMQRYTVPDGVEIIVNGAFSETTIGDITLPTSCHTLETMTFFECKAPRINLESVKYINGTIFQASLLVEINIPGHWESLPSSFAMNPFNLQKIVINEGVKYISARAFYRPTKVHTLILPKSVVSIGDYAFYQSTLTSLNLPNGDLAYIGKYAFASNIGWTTIVIPRCVRLIEWRAFSVCSKLEFVEIMNCETWWAPDSFLSTEKKVQVVCIATRRFTDPRENLVVYPLLFSLRSVATRKKPLMALSYMWLSDMPDIY